MQPVEIRPWRPSPFAVGQRYRVRRDFQSLRDSFRAGEVLTYERDTWSRYDECTGYVFTQSGTSILRLWDVYDTEDVAVWRDLFEALPDVEPSAT
jgi:hypothetical protein